MKRLYTDEERAAYGTAGKWQAKWICHPEGSAEESALYCCRLEFGTTEEQTLRLKVSADQRYILFVDGVREGEGPERGDSDNWFFETYELTVSPGRHSLTALVWFIRYEDRPPVAQMFWRPGFLLECPELPELSTGSGPWRILKVPGYRIETPNHETYTGSRFTVRGAEVPRDFLSGGGDGWREPAVLWRASNKYMDRGREFLTKWHLRPCMLPAPYEGEIKGIRAVACDHPLSDSTEEVRIAPPEPAALAEWQSFFDGGSVTVPPETRVRVIADMGNYYCVRHRFLTVGGRGSRIRLRYAETLFEDLKTFRKGNRDEYLGKAYHGVGVDYYPGGARDEEYFSLWWYPGRYMEIYVETAGESLTLSSPEFGETHYDYAFDASFESSDGELYSFAPIALRALEMCTHETLMDCPFYEQLMYVGDTRLELLTVYSVSRDRHIAKKAVDTFDKSIGTEGLTKSRYPSHLEQHIPPFSLFYVAMVHDYLTYTGDRAFAAELMHGVRGVMDFFERHENGDGLLQAPQGWNFTDWVPGFPGGHSDYTARGVSGYYNAHWLYTLLKAAELEDFMGERALAERYRRRAEELLQRFDRTFWKEDRGLYSEDAAGALFWEHTQCLAILTGLLPEDRVRRITDALAEGRDIHRTTIYFSHYLLEAAAAAGRSDIFYDRLAFWSGLPKQGFRTTPESPEPPRSDCHAWGAHPLYHLQANALGVRPAEPGFGRVSVKPMLGRLKWAKGSMPHPAGSIECSYDNTGETLTGRVTLPRGVTGTLTANGRTIELKEGVNDF
ncbi:MAG: alpha-L-rhamnosidase [Abditibacteriota bacterium]|nr:alpha-L-rhamnosidase [Abditibacteriota bacterium]